MRLEPAAEGRSELRIEGCGTYKPPHLCILLAVSPKLPDEAHLSILALQKRGEGMFLISLWF